LHARVAQVGKRPTPPPHSRSVAGMMCQGGKLTPAALQATALRLTLEARNLAIVFATKGTRALMVGPARRVRPASTKTSPAAHLVLGQTQALPTALQLEVTRFCASTRTTHYNTWQRIHDVKVEEEEEEAAAAAEEKERLYLLARGANGQGRSCTVHFPTANGKPDMLSNLLHEFLPWRAMGKNPSHRGSSVLGLRPARWPWPHQQHVRVCMCVCARARIMQSHTHIT